MMAAALRRTATHVISRPMACREAARHRRAKRRRAKCKNLLKRSKEL